jgi:hypothetical protein
MECQSQSQSCQPSSVNPREPYTEYNRSITGLEMSDDEISGSDLDDYFSSLCVTDRFNEIEKFLKSLDAAIIEAINADYKIFLVYNNKKIKAQEPIKAIIMCLGAAGCCYDEEINAALKCLRQHVALYKSGRKDINFNPHQWESLCTVETLFGAVQSK